MEHFWGVCVVITKQLGVGFVIDMYASGGIKAAFMKDNGCVTQVIFIIAVNNIPLLASRLAR